MGIIYLQPQKHKCSKCGGKGKPYSRSARPERLGNYKGIRCIECGHKTEMYEPTLQELEMGSRKSWTSNPNSPLPF